jgi:mannosyl-oligosaccharide alpha-1,2-mannosidase
MPISGKGKTVSMFGDGWAATLIDNLDTLLIMGLDAEFGKAVDAVTSSIHFGPPPTSAVTISTFETTIRHLGGLISAYDLTGCTEPRLLDKAIELGDMLIRAFDNPSHMPVTRWDLQRASEFAKSTTQSNQMMYEQPAADNAIIAEFASFGPEFTRLSQLTGDMRYYDKVHRVSRAMQAQQNGTMIPGMWPIGINAKAPDLTTGMKFGVGTMADSAFEYLAKMHALIGGVASPSYGAVSEEADFVQMYTHFITASENAGLFFRPVVPDDLDILFTADISTIEIFPKPSIAQHRRDYTGAHLACFFGGNLLMAGRLLSRASDVDLGLKVTNGCIWAYQASPFGIMPEKFELKSCDEHYLKLNSGSCKFNETLWDEQYGHGGSNKDVHVPGMVRITEKGYFLRPEAIESVFYAYRVTGDPKYREIAWEMFQSIEKWTATQFGNAALGDVTVPGMVDGKELPGGGPLKQDSMESFWLAETLKYFFLIFSDESVINLDEWVLNTEAHPFKRPRF